MGKGMMKQTIYEKDSFYFLPLITFDGLTPLGFPSVSLMVGVPPSQGKEG